MKKLMIGMLLASFCVITIGCGGAIKPCDVQLGTHSAVTPVPVDEDWWTSRHQGVLDRIKEGNVNLILIGDSITHGWEEEAKSTWDKYYGSRGAVNMGFSGDQTQHVLWRLDNGEVDNIDPKLAVLMIGTNNSNGQEYTSEEIADGIKAIVCKLRTKLPNTKVLILSIFPRGSDEQMEDRTKGASPNPQWAKNEKASELASQIADNKMIYCLDINPAFLDENGTMTREVMPDLLHPFEKGYKIWAEAMEPTVKKLMGE